MTAQASQAQRLPACFQPMLHLACNTQQAGCRMPASLRCPQQSNQKSILQIKLPEVRLSFLQTTPAHTCPHLPQVQKDSHSLLPASGLRLQQAAEQLLPSSSSDSEADATDGQDPSEILAPPHRAAQAIDIDSGSDEASHRKHKRRSESAKHKKHKKHRSVSSSPPTPVVPVFLLSSSGHEGSLPAWLH